MGEQFNIDLPRVFRYGIGTQEEKESQLEDYLDRLLIHLEESFKRVFGRLDIRGSIQDSDVDTSVETEDTEDSDQVVVIVNETEVVLFTTNVTESYVQINAHEDADGDTKVQVEESADEDHIRMDTAGVEAMVIDAAQDVEIMAGSLAIPSNERMLFDGLSGGTSWKWNSSSGYFEAYVQGEIRMQM